MEVDAAKIFTVSVWCLKNWSACITVAHSLWDRQAFILKIYVGLKCLGKLRSGQYSASEAIHTHNTVELIGQEHYVLLSNSPVTVTHKH